MTERSFDALRVIDTAKEVERKGQAFYQEAANAVSDQRVKSLFLELAGEEARHIQDLEEIRIGFEKAFPNLPHEVSASDLTARFKDVLFPDDPSKIMADTGKLTEIQALERGIQLERDTIDLYEGAAEKEVNPGAANAFRRLVMKERMHLHILNQRRDLLKMRS